MNTLSIRCIKAAFGYLALGIGLGAWFAAKIPPAGDRLTSGRVVLRLRSPVLPDPTS